MKQEDNSQQPLAGVTIKTEPGTSASPMMQRLPSLRPPRDLSLSAFGQPIPNLTQSKNKKIYVPNLNVQRNKPAENATAVKSEPAAKPNLPDKFERGRGRGKRNLVQLNQGVFSEGIPGGRNLGRGRSSGGLSERSDNVLKKPTLKLKNNIKVDKEEEENTVKQLLRDDFIDDPTLEPDYKNCPIMLPLMNCKEESALKKKCDIKPVIKKENLTVNDVLYDPTLHDPGFMFLQLPSSMPGLRADAQADDSHPPPSASSSAQPAPATTKENDRCLLSSLPGGQVGKLQILKSGRARLVFGDTKMWLELGTQVAFKQDLVAVELDKETHTGNMMSLGPVSVRMVATPDWESMLAAVKTEKQKAAS